MNTIVAPATALVEQPIGIIRISGEDAYPIALKLTQKTSLTVRAVYTLDIGIKEKLDKAVVIYFKAPYSFTGEDVIEIQMHGNPYLMNRVMQEIVKLGAVLAKPGEFSLRAFKNGKISLIQAESIADLIHAKSEKAALSASRSMQGQFCEQIYHLQDQVLTLRAEVESVIDFDESDIPTMSVSMIKQRLEQVISQVEIVINIAKSGVRLSNAIEIVLAGHPNVGKSTLMNALCQDAVAIITEQAGTTRDLITRDIVYDGIPMRITDTAGLRESEDIVEKEGINRAKKIMQQADLVLHLLDDLPAEELPSTPATIWRIRNKVDLGSIPLQTVDHKISAKTGEGMDAFKDALVQFARTSTGEEATFSARMRHLQSLEEAHQVLHAARSTGEHDMLAQELMIAHHYLGQAVGESTPDDVLANIFSKFCIGK
ncbi:tRNA uridine-5-carboxymethylaminomethyl(34) synthesis GTPase MnmE [Gammaproteobacteria bacterium]|nr:tRNA uridine-5-carboxymethylaminomethyl(34) synthesis GTPase MnmE [Gammaproteobacteria bacterium]